MGFAYRHNWRQIALLLSMHVVLRAAESATYYPGLEWASWPLMLLFAVSSWALIWQVVMLLTTRLLPEKLAWPDWFSAPISSLSQVFTLARESLPVLGMAAVAVLAGNLSAYLSGTLLRPLDYSPGIAEIGFFLALSCWVAAHLPVMLVFALCLRSELRLTKTMALSSLLGVATLGAALIYGGFWQSYEPAHSPLATARVAQLAAFVGILGVVTLTLHTASSRNPVITCLMLLVPAGIPILMAIAGGAGIYFSSLSALQAFWAQSWAVPLRWFFFGLYPVNARGENAILLLTVLLLSVGLWGFAAVRCLNAARRAQKQ